MNNDPVVHAAPPQTALDLAKQIVDEEMKASGFALQSTMRHGEPGMDRAMQALMLTEMHIIRVLLEELVERSGD